MTFAAQTNPAPSGFYCATKATAPAGAFAAATAFAVAGSFWATLTPVDTSMPNYVFNQPQITGLTGGAAPLAALNLSYTQTPTVVLTFDIASPYAGVCQLTYVMQAGTPAQSSPSVILSTVLTGQYWQLTAAVFNGAVCGLNQNDNLFYPTVTQTVSGVPVQSPASVGFSVPT